MAGLIKTTSAAGLSGKQRGFTYLMLLLWVVIAGAMLAALGTSWSLMARREREAELLWRGEQYRRALVSYAKRGMALQVQAANEAAQALAAAPAASEASSAPVQPSVQGPLELRDLLEDRRSGQLVRHIRQLYGDPVTRSPKWGIERTPEGRISGIFSLSDEEPVRRSLGVERYRDLVFSSAGVVAPVAASAASGASAGPSTGSLTGSSFMSSKSAGKP